MSAEPQPPTFAPEQFRRVRIEVPNLHGNLRGKVVPAHKLGGGLHFCNAVFALDVDDGLFETTFASAENAWEDVVAVPDLATLRPVPWEPGVGAVVCDWHTTAGEPHPLCHRAAVRAAERRLAALGLEARVGLEFELFAFYADPDALAEGRYEDLRRLSHLQQAYSFQRWPAMGRLVERIFDELSEYGAVVESCHTELGCGVVEVALKPLAPLAAADAAARLRSGLKEIAAAEGIVVTFMAKCHHDDPGSSGHVHQSLLRDGEPVTATAAGELTDLARAYAEGLLAATPDLAAFYGPYMNSYRRPNASFWAPTRADWGYDNRLTCVRALALDPRTSRLEMRRSGADLAIYLAVAGSLAAGARGIELGLELRPEAPRRGEDARTEALPATLRAATERLRGSRLARELVGEGIVDHYLAGLDAEIAATDAELARVTSWELRRYMETA